VQFEYDDYHQSFIVSDAMHQKRIYLYVNRPLKIADKDDGRDKIKIDLFTEVDIISTDRLSIRNIFDYQVPSSGIPNSTGASEFKTVSLLKD
jgi:hypothetical protein